MFNTVVGSAIGGLVAGVVALGAASVMTPSPVDAFAQRPHDGAVRSLVTEPIAQAPAPAAVASPEMAAQPVNRHTVSARSSTRVAATRRGSSRPWAKTAMIIGGSTGTGAGLGGLIGGKKGALIGAALGGGAATIYEARKR